MVLETGLNPREIASSWILILNASYSAILVLNPLRAWPQTGGESHYNVSLEAAKARKKICYSPL
jgi:hypothetical protein